MTFSNGLNNFHRVGSKATDALIRFGAEAVPTLIDSLGDPNSEVRVRAAVILAAIRDERSVPALIERLSDKEGSGWGKPMYTCDVAAKALILIGTPEALEAVENWQVNLINELIGMESQSYSNHWSIQEMLEWSPDDFRTTLSKAFDTVKVLGLCSKYLPWGTVEALGIIGNPAAVPALERSLKNASDQDDSQMTSTIIRALERMVRQTRLKPGGQQQRDRTYFIQNTCPATCSGECCSARALSARI